MLLVIVFVLISGFARDSQAGEKVVLNRKSVAGHVIPVKIWGATIPNNSSGATMCTPVQYGIAHTRAGWLDGHMTHGGKLVPGQSPWEIVSCNTDLSTNLNTSQINGVITVINGSSLSYKCTMIINIVTNRAILDVSITDGDGMFEGVTGHVTMTGNHEGDGVVTFSGEGYMSFAK